MKKTKKAKFAIYVDELGRDKLYLKKIVSMLNEEYSFLKEERKLSRSKSISKARAGDIVVFGSSKYFDYTTVSKGEFESDSDFDEIEIFSLTKEFTTVKRRLQKYVGKNHYYELDDSIDTGCFFIFEDRDYCYDDVDILIVPPKKKKVTTRKKKSSSELVLDKVQVFHDYVQVGWDNFDIMVDLRTGKEFVKVDGRKYNVERDMWGKGRLTV